MQNRNHSWSVRITAAAAVAVAVTAGILLALRPVARAAGGAEGDRAESAPRRVKVLFLGDNGHHRPLERCRQIVSELGRRGVDLTYTDRIADLTAEKLNRYDCLLLFANIEQIAPEQEKALLDYVAGGKGLVALHCSSFMFQNSEAFIALVGGQFQRHGTGEFSADIVQAEHPITKGFQNFTTPWDETYVHTKHNPADRTVLMERVDAQGREPYTWVRTHGKGRVFYTSIGHMPETFMTPSLVGHMLAGVQYALGDLKADATPNPPSAGSVSAR